MESKLSNLRLNSKIARMCCYPTELRHHFGSKISQILWIEGWVWCLSRLAQNTNPTWAEHLLVQYRHRSAASFSFSLQKKYFQNIEASFSITFIKTIQWFSCSKHTLSKFFASEWRSLGVNHCNGYKSLLLSSSCSIGHIDSDLMMHND